MSQLGTQFARYLKVWMLQKPAHIRLAYTEI